MSSPTPTPVERALAAAIYAPVGLGAQLVDDVPAALTKVRQQLVFARFIGKMAVDQGVKELRHRLAPPPPDGETASTEAVVPAAASVESDAPDARLASTESAAPATGELALPDYDQLPASHIVSKLAGLTSHELTAIEAYESAHRHRRTVLGKIAQLQAG